MEESKINEWRTPVLHDAIRATVFCADDRLFAPAVAVMRKMLKRGANPNAVDSYGNTCLMRAILDARQRIPRGTEERVSAKLLADIGEVFKALIAAGADVHLRQPDRASAMDETRGTMLAGSFRRIRGRKWRSSRSISAHGYFRYVARRNPRQMAI
jgi:hypothetical protein